MNIQMLIIIGFFAIVINNFRLISRKKAGYQGRMWIKQGSYQRRKGNCFDKER